ncbi:hypothetical protein DACRYDRAFT_20490 [Dacryopinax primogenitus]|uniref:Uncharacterized protein n=1 Tax=Dacryopinax primogenitus (strain DJM 731) TaxID=1858805 RepID=M5GDW7_DACPD|nr:uncharacterized protein DACRYDRAFT_20490 [Dacryopinax primogenitus]EJU04892.1 hypothetical protein DACRYDRAFT_20490 [Dacryopinax primogenitus]
MGRCKGIHSAASPVERPSGYRADALIARGIRSHVGGNENVFGGGRNASSAQSWEIGLQSCHQLSYAWLRAEVERIC